MEGLGEEVLRLGVGVVGFGVGSRSGGGDGRTSLHYNEVVGLLVGGEVVDGVIVMI